MNLKKLKHQFLEKKFHRELSKTIQNRVVYDKKITSVAILTHEDFSEKEGLKVAVEKELELRNCKVFTFRNFDKINDISYDHFDEKDFSWFGKLDNTSLQSFLDQPFDLLITFFDEKNLYLEFATMLSKSKFKAGFTEVNHELYDIEIAEKLTNYPIFLKELKIYLKILKKL